MTALFLRLLAIYIGATPLYAQSVVGANSAQLLSQGPGAEAAALGGTVVSTVHDPTALYWNPAGLTEAGGTVAGEHLFLFGGARYDFVGLSVQSQVGSFGVGAVQLNQGNIVARTTIDDPGTDVSNTQSVYMAGYAHTLGEHWSAGVTGNVLDYNVAGYSAKGWGVDVGTQGHYASDDFLGLPRVVWSLGASVKNLIQPQVTLMDTAEDYPRELRAGAAMSFETAARPQSSGVIEHDRASLLFSVHQVAGDPGLNPAIGMAYDYLGVLVFRLGYNGNLSGGMGFHTFDDTFSLDYSMENDPLTLNYRFTISYRFDKPARKPQEKFREIIDDEYAQAKAQAESLAKENYAAGQTFFRDQKFHEAEGSFQLASLLTPEDKSMSEAYRRAHEAFRVQETHRLSDSFLDHPAPGEEDRAYFGIPERLGLNVSGDDRSALARKLPAAAQRLAPERAAQLYREVVDTSTATARQLLAAGHAAAAGQVADMLSVIVSSQDALAVAMLAQDAASQANAVRKDFEDLSAQQVGHADARLARAALAFLRAFPDDAANAARARAALEVYRDEHPLTIKERFYILKLYYLAAAVYARRTDRDLQNAGRYLSEVLTRDPANEDADTLWYAMVQDGLAK